MKKLSRFFLLLIGLLLGIIISDKIAERYINRAKLNEKLQYLEERIKNGRQYGYSCKNKDLGSILKKGVQQRLITSEFDFVCSVNSKGIRDKEVSYEKPEKEFRILALGESTVFGEGINYGKRFTEIIEQQLGDVEVVNMGIGGYGMDQALLFLEKEGFKFNPDLAILFICVEDFFQRCKYSELWKEPKPRFVLNENKDKLILQKIDFIENECDGKSASRGNESPEKFNTKEINNKKNNNFIKGSELLKILNYYMRKKTLMAELKNKDKQHWYRDHAVSGKDRSLQKVYNNKELKKVIFLILKKYKELCNENKVDFLVVNALEHKINYINIKGLCEELDISCLDLFDVLSEVSKYKRLRFEIDPHNNEFGHKVIGGHVSTYLRECYKLK